MPDEEPQGVTMNLNLLKSKPRLALLGASGMIAAGALAGTAVISQAASPTPSAQVAPAQAETPDAPGTEAPEVAGAEKPEANEPALPGGGHADTGSTADHQFDGVE
jgi:hypothetical protein